MKRKTLYLYFLSYTNREGNRMTVSQEAHNLDEAKRRAQDDRPVMKNIKVVKRSVLSQGERSRR